MATIKCPVCGAEFPADEGKVYNFCIICGAPLAEAAAPAPAEAAPVPPAAVPPVQSAPQEPPVQSVPQGLYAPQDQPVQAVPQGQYAPAPVQPPKPPKQAGGKKKLLFILLPVALVAIIAVVLIALTPAFRYSKGTKLREAGDYAGAITAFEKAGNYKDAAEQIPATYYAQGEALLAGEDFGGAAEAFKNAGDYEDAKVRFADVNFAYGKALAEDGKYDEAIEQLATAKNLYGELDAAVPDGLEETVQTCYKKLGAQYYEDGKYKEAFDTLRNLTDYLKDDTYLHAAYQLGIQYTQEEKFEEAYKLLSSKSLQALIKEEKDGKTNLDNAAYGYAQKLVAAKDYDTALTVLKGCKHKDVTPLLREAQYGYVLAHKDPKDKTVFAYLKVLAKAKYKDSADIYKELYSWKLINMVINTKENDEKTDKSTFKLGERVYFHFTVSGGTPGGELTIKVTYTRPDKTTGTYTFPQTVKSGETTWYSWQSNSTEAKRAGKMTFTFYAGKTVIAKETITVEK